MCSDCDPDAEDPPFLEAMGNFFKMVLSPGVGPDEFRINAEDYEREDRIWL